MIKRRTFAALLAGTVAAPKRAWSEPVTGHTSVGPEADAVRHRHCRRRAAKAQHGDASRQHSICLAASIQTISLCRVEQRRARRRRRQASRQRIPRRSGVRRLDAAWRAAIAAITPDPYQRRQIRQYLLTGEEVDFESLGGAMAHNSKSGVAHLAAEDEDACLQDTRYLLSFLPQNNLETAPRVVPTDDPMRMDEELDRVVPDSRTSPTTCATRSGSTMTASASTSTPASTGRRTWRSVAVNGHGCRGGGQPARAAGGVSTSTSASMVPRASCGRRCLQHPVDDLHRRAGLLPGTEQGGAASPRRQAAVRLEATVPKITSHMFITGPDVIKTVTLLGSL